MLSLFKDIHLPCSNIILFKDFLGSTPVFNISQCYETNSGNPVDYLTKLLCGRVSAQFLPDYLCQLKTKKHKQNAAKYAKNAREIFSLSGSVNFSLYLTGENADISLVVIVLVSVLGTLYQQGRVWQMNTIDPNSNELFLLQNSRQSFKALIRLQTSKFPWKCEFLEKLTSFDSFRKYYDD